LTLIGALANKGVPTVAEGGITSPEQARAALEAGASFVVVGKAITDPLARTAAFVSSLAGQNLGP
jgi:N-acylglucosamine-6-phosphate 2-epimerase